MRTSRAEGRNREASVLGWTVCLFVDITENGDRSRMERTESGAKVFSECGGVAGDQRMPASQSAEKVWPDSLKGPGVYSRAPVRVVAWMLPGAASLGTKQLDFLGRGNNGKK